ncbi:MAG: anhydro-N-acetylmuramic acid kinase [Sphingomonadales bacterium]
MDKVANTQGDGPRVAIGMMSGTSMDGIDIAAISTDGDSILARSGGAMMPYPPQVRSALAAALETARSLGTKTDALDGLGAQITRLHADVVKDFLSKHSALQPDVIGFHGQTVLHRPERRLTWQIGDGSLLAELTGIPVVWDVRAKDVASGGQGAPLASAYHAAIVDDEQPVAILNLGGVANITWVSPNGDLMAMDCGPANALVDMWVATHDAGKFDEGGRIAARGSVREDILTNMADNPFFDAPPPKSLDRLDFDLGPVRGLNLSDGAATLTAFTAEAVWIAQTHFPEPVGRWLVTGGGRHNQVLMEMIQSRVSAPVEPIEAAGYDGDLLEAEAFAFLAVRSMQGKPLTFPSTTGAPEPLPGGILSEP